MTKRENSETKSVMTRTIALQMNFKILRVVDVRCRKTNETAKFCVV